MHTLYIEGLDDTKMENFKLDLIYSTLQFINIKYKRSRRDRRIIKQKI